MYIDTHTKESMGKPKNQNIGSNKMESQGEIYISRRYRKRDYSNLKLAIGSNPQKWNTAVDILRDRIYGRFFDQINLLSGDIEANGFAIMALNCLLIETLIQFKDGIRQIPPKQNQKEYASFLCAAFPNDFENQEVAKRFYQDIRCGILHSAQTSNKSRLSDGYFNTAARIEESVLVVSVARVTEILKEYFDSYSNKLLNPKENELRENFVKKMRFVCRR